MRLFFTIATAFHRRTNRIKFFKLARHTLGRQKSH